MEIAIYTFCVMYSPGPVNILALNDGLKGHGWHLAGYCIGVGVAMYTGFLVLGYVGEAIVRGRLLSWIAVLGSAYILHLAYRLYSAQPHLETTDARRERLRFHNGYLLQLLNPKGFVVILPVTSVMFPAAGIRGVGIAGCAALISLGAVGAPALYAAGGAWLGRRFLQPRIFSLFNKAMAAMLAFVALSILYDFFIQGGSSGSGL